LPSNIETGGRGVNGESESEQQLLSRAFARLDAVALGVAVGVVSGLGLWVLTAILLLQGGQKVGLHLNRLSFFLIGYDVSWFGAVIGAVEMGVVGFLLGAFVAWLWNAYHGMFIAIVVARQQRQDIARELQGL
jgi:hypothetical protein